MCHVTNKKCKVVVGWRGLTGPFKIVDPPVRGDEVVPGGTSSLVCLTRLCAGGDRSAPFRRGPDCLRPRPTPVPWVSCKDLWVTRGTDPDGGDRREEF